MPLYPPSAGGGGASAATQAEMEAASLTNVYASPGRTQYHPGVCKGWVVFNGTGTIAVEASHNLDGSTPLVDNGTGDWTINWATDFSSANYAVVGASRRDTTNTNYFSVAPVASNPAAGSVRVVTKDVGDVLRDSQDVYVAAFGDQ